MTRLDEAVAALNRARELAGKTGSPLHVQVERELAEVRKLRPLVARLSAVLKGEDRPANAAEGHDFARMAFDIGHFAATVRLSQEALAADTKRPDEWRAQLLVMAGSAAVQAGCGKDRNEPPPDELVRRQRRQEGLAWMKEALVIRDQLLQQGTPQERMNQVSLLRPWKNFAFLAAVRDPASIALLPQNERADWRAFWNDLDVVLTNAKVEPKSENNQDPFQRRHRRFRIARQGLRRGPWDPPPRRWKWRNCPQFRQPLGRLSRGLIFFG